MFGIDDRTLKVLLKYFEGQKEIEEVRIYGSRAMAKEKPGSDIDLAIVTNVTQDLSGRIKTDLEELPTPYFFDVTDLRYLEYTPLKDHIDQFGKVFYRKSAT